MHITVISQPGCLVHDKNTSAALLTQIESQHKCFKDQAWFTLRPSALNFTLILDQSQVVPDRSVNQT